MKAEGLRSQALRVRKRPIIIPLSSFCAKIFKNKTPLFPFHKGRPSSRKPLPSRNTLLATSDDPHQAQPFRANILALGLTALGTRKAVTTLGNRIATPKAPSIDLIRILSEGTYTSFAQALKEFISNAYDAYATNVALRFDDDFSSLSIRDNGLGMASNDFENVFASIARTSRTTLPSPELKRWNRERIGRFGIGSLAIVGTADRFTIKSVKKGGGKGFEASIDLKEVRSYYEKGQDLKDVWRFALSDWGEEKNSTHFTEITVDGIRDDIRRLLQRSGKSLNDPFQSVVELSGIEELRWQLGIICPVEYANKYPIPARAIDPTRDRILVDASARLHKSNFAVTLNQLPVKNPTLLPSYDPERAVGAEGKLLQRKGLGYDVAYLQSAADSKVTYKGYLCVQAHQVFPTELRGILIRLRGVAVGWHRTLHLGASVATMLTSMSGEVWVEGLDEALQFDRESFREDNPLFVWLKDRIQETVNDETIRFRDRSARRIAMIKRKHGTGSKRHKPAKKKDKAARSSASYLQPEILEKMPPYIVRLVPQINGTYDNEWFEGTAMVLRRLMETLIIELYTRRGWHKEVQDHGTNEFLQFKSLIDKLNGDARLGMQKRTIDGLKSVKEVGDTAAHDFRIRIRKSDLDKIQSAVRLTCERLIFTIGESAPTT